MNVACSSFSNLSLTIILKSCGQLCINCIFKFVSVILMICHFLYTLFTLSANCWLDLKAIKSPPANSNITIFELCPPFRFWTIEWCPENFVMISLTVQELSRLQTNKQTHKRTLLTRILSSLRGYQKYWYTLLHWDNLAGGSVGGTFDVFARECLRQH